LSDQLGIPFIDLSAMSISQQALQEVPERLAKKHQILPVAVLRRSCTWPMADPLKFEALQDVRFTSNCTIVPLLATGHRHQEGESSTTTRRRRAKPSTMLVKDMAGDLPLELMQEGDGDNLADDKRRAESAPIVRMVNLIVSQAVETGRLGHPSRAGEDESRRAQPRRRPAAAFARGPQVGAGTGHLADQGHVADGHCRTPLPQDGRVAIKVGQKTLDLRVSSVPARTARKIVIRILDSSKVTGSLDTMGLEPSSSNTFRA
jgi:type IV pilus assembly protein PilB